MPERTVLPGRLQQAAHRLSSELERYARWLGHRDRAASIAAVAPGRPWHTHWSQGRVGTGHQTLTGHDRGVTTVATRALPDGTPVIISSSTDATVRTWRLADSPPLDPPLWLPASIQDTATRGDHVVTAAGIAIAAHSPAALTVAGLCRRRREGDGTATA